MEKFQQNHHPIKPLGGETIESLNPWLRKRAAEDLKIDLSESQLMQFSQYYHQLIASNHQINLTSITEPDEVYGKHFYDSLTLATVVSFPHIETVIDVGTGAGFPGIPLKIAYPHLQVVLLDSLKKRVAFLEDVIRQLGLSGITCVHGRAEDLGHQKAYRQQFDVSVARAVAKLNILAEYCLPFVKVKGSFVAMKGAHVEEELHQAKRAFHLLGKASYQSHAFSLPDQLGLRTIIRVEKKKDTPHAYPRRAGIPKKQPL